jgi:hypothetical protein
MRRWRAQEGQASVELVALLPLIAVLGLLLWQAALAGHAVWMAAAAARSAARAEAIGADARAAARTVLPPALERGLRVRTHADGGVRVWIRMPRVFGGAPVATVSSTARVAPQR